MSIPIICLAKAEEPHRFEVAKVTADLVCTTCKSPDIDFDEVTAAAKTAEDNSCSICGKPGIIEAKWMSSTGNEVVETNYFCEDHRGSANNWSGDVETRRLGAKTAGIDWRGATHLGVGYLTGTAPNGDVYEVYSNPNSNPTPCSWVRYGPEGDTGLGSGIDAGRGYTTMQEAMAAAEEHAKGVSATASKTADFTDPEMAEVKDTSSVSQKVTCSSCLTEHVITAVDPAQPMPSCPSCGRDTLSPAGSTLAARKTAGWAIVSPSGTNLWGMVYDTEEGARAHFDEVKGLGSTLLAPSDVASYEVKQVNAEPNRTYDPSLGGNKFQPLGSKRVSIYTETGETYTQPCDTCGKPVTFRWLENEGGFRTSEPADGGGSDHISTWCAEHTPARRQATRKTADAYQEAVRRGMMMGTSEFINPGAMLPSSVYVVMEPGPNGARPTDRKTTSREVANEWAKELLARTDWSPYTSSLDAAFAALTSTAAGEVYTPDERAPAFASREERIAAKINRIADGVLATNPGMNRQSALAVAGKTLATYPSMIEGN